tara:strand:- start:2892 stop:3794 length:903 start_codon:yes stop_codon:yes gene_type:complete
MGSITGSDISNFLNSPLIGENFEINFVSSCDNPKTNTLSFLIKKNKNETFHTKKLILISKNIKLPKTHKCTFIQVENPKLDYSRVCNFFFPLKKSHKIESKVPKSCQIAKNVSIGKNCTIGENIIINENSIIYPNTIIHDNTIIGKNCIIFGNSYIGMIGFGFAFNKNKTPTRIPHYGKTIIEDNVEIGSHCIIARGTIDNTTIHSNVKIDSYTYISHNCIIGENTIITAHNIISGSVSIGSSCWIGPNCSIIQKITIGNNVTIGIGSTVTRSIEDNTTVMGLEAKPLKELGEIKTRLNY